MAEGISASVTNAILDCYFRATNITAPTAVYAQLHIGSPGAAGTANQATNTTRQQVVCGTAASGGVISNTTAVTWTAVPATEDYTHLTVWSASSGGTFLWSGSITAAAVPSGSDFTVAVGDLDVSLTVAS